MAKNEGSEAKSSKKWLQVSRRREACMVVSRRPYKDQLGKVSCEAGIVHKWKMKKRRKAGEEGDQMAAQWEGRAKDGGDHGTKKD